MSDEVKKTGQVVVNMTVDEDALKQMAVKIIEENDFVKVVRCKDCKYGKWKISELDNKKKGYECAIHAVFENDFGDNGYCSYGENAEAQEEREIINARKGEE